MPQLTIRNPEAIRLARELAALEGKSLTTVVTEALREKLERERVPQINEERMRYVLELGRQVREHMERVDPEWLQRDHIADLYDDESGLRK